MIATYNALQFLTNGNSKTIFPELLAHFEHGGITLGGEFGTSPYAVYNFFKKKGYDAKIITGLAKKSVIEKLQETYATYIMLAYNNKDDLGKMVHYVNVTKENRNYVIHNNGQEREQFFSLQDAVNGYGDHNGRAICLIGIREKQT